MKAYWDFPTERASQLKGIDKVEWHVKALACEFVSVLQDFNVESHRLFNVC